MSTRHTAPCTIPYLPTHFCEVDWFGVDCAKRRCQADVPSDAAAGSSAESSAESAEPACHGHGACVDGACECDDGWLAPDCG